MKLRQRLELLVRTVWDDLFGEGSEGSDRSQRGKLPLDLDEGRLSPELSEGHLTGLLEEAQRRLDELRRELADATVRQKRVELEWQAAQAQAKSLSDEVDVALKAGQEELARERLVQAQRSSQTAEEVGELYQACESLTRQISEAIQLQQAQLEAARRKAQELAERERGAEIMEWTARLRRDMARQSEAMQSELRQREEQVARREDKLAARRELDNMERS